MADVNEGTPRGRSVSDHTPQALKRAHRLASVGSVGQSDPAALEAARFQPGQLGRLHSEEHSAQARARHGTVSHKS